MKKSFALFSFILLAGILSFTSCKKDKEDTTKHAPVVPPVSTFAIDFEQFGQASDTSGNRSTAFFGNWAFSYLNVMAWHTVVNVHMIVPVAAFKESFNHEAIFDPQNNHWNWSYNVSANNVTYLARLSGEVVADSVNWEMRISQPGTAGDFRWFSGTSAVNQQGGYWVLYENPTSPNVLLKINWQHTSDQVANIKYINIKPGDAQKGAYIAYGATLENLNRYYAIYNKIEANTTNIEWNDYARNGRVKDPAHFQDNNWHCWDTNLFDTNCN